MHNQYSIRVYKQYFNFAAGHFLIFDDGTREPLHGHNYRVQVEGHGNQLESDMVFDFLDLKPIVREVCDSLDHCLLLPSDNPHLRIDDRGTNYLLSTPDNGSFSIPKMDVLILPLPNTSAERLAIYIANQIKEKLLQKHAFCFKKLIVEVEETPGQAAVYVME